MMMVRKVIESTLDVEAVVRRRMLAGEAVERVAEDLGLRLAQPDEYEWVDGWPDGPAVVLPGWWADDGCGGAKIEYPAAGSGLEAAEEYVADGCWGDGSQTEWIDVWVCRRGLALDEGGEIAIVAVDRENVTVPIEPEEPGCDHPEGHEWASPHEIVGGIEENPGVYGHGGGVVITEVCLRCGCGRHTDTWAQRRDTGEQGLRQVTYVPGEFAEEVEA